MLNNFYDAVERAAEKTMLDGFTAMGAGVKAATAIVGDIMEGDEPEASDINKLLKAGWDMAAIASLYGLSTNVVEQIWQDVD